MKEYVAKIQNTCALIEASRSRISEAEKVKIVLVGLPSEHDVVLTLASFSFELLPMQRLVDVLLEYKIRQTRVAQDVPFHANLMEAAPTPIAVEPARGGHSFTGGNGRGFNSQILCQFCGKFGRLAQRCYYRFNRDYDNPSTTIAQALNA